MPWSTRLFLAFFPFPFPLGRAQAPSVILSYKVVYKMIIQDNRMHTPALKGLPWFPFHLDVILSPRDPGTTSLELAEPRAANFSGFCQFSFKRMCGDAKAPVLISPDTDSKQRDGRQGEAVGMRRGSSLPFFSPATFRS